MNTLGVAVAWAAIIAALTSVVSVVLGARAASKAHRDARQREVSEAFEHGKQSQADLLEQCRKDRDYWRDRIIRRMEHE